MVDQLADAIADSEQKVATMSAKLKELEDRTDEPSPNMIFQMQSLRANLRRSRARLGRLRTEQRAAEKRD